MESPYAGAIGHFATERVDLFDTDDRLIGRVVLPPVGALRRHALEILVHVEHAEFRPRFVSIEVAIPETLVSDAEAGIDAMDPLKAHEAGTRWLEGEASAVLPVPSVVIPRFRLHLVNPRHPDAVELKIGKPEPFEFGPRLFRS